MTDKLPTRSKYDLDFSKIHGVITPADIRINDRVEARVRIHGTEEYFPLRVWKASSLGAELVLSEKAPSLSKGSIIDLELIVAGQRVSFDGSVVEIIQENDQIQLAGVRYYQQTSQLGIDSDRRRMHRWECSPEYYPTATCPTPGQINDHVYFKIRDLSSDGMQLTCSLRNKILIPGMTLQLTANFGVDGTFHTPVEIARVGFANEAGKDMLAIGVTFKALNSRMKSIISQYLIQFSNATSLDELKLQGFWPKSVSTAVNFYYLTTLQEYEDVKNLRQKAHEADANLNQSVSISQMGDRYDSSSRIIIGSHNGEIVCTARIRFNTNDEPLEHDELIDWPENMPRRSEIVEVSRLAIDPRYRHGDLLIGLFEFIATTCVHDHHYVLMSCLPRMIPFFERVGFEQTGLSYQSDIFNDHGHVLIGDIFAILVGRKVNPIYWNLVYRRVSDFMIDAQIIRPQGIDRARLKIYRMCSPIAKVLSAYKRRQINKPT